VTSCIRNVARKGRISRETEKMSEGELAWRRKALGEDKGSTGSAKIRERVREQV